MNTRTSVPPPLHSEFLPEPDEAAGVLRAIRVVQEDTRAMTRYWPVLVNMVQQDLRVRYQRSVLGFLWTLLNPILMMGTMALVFSQLFKTQSASQFAIYLFAGLLPYGMLHSTISECAVCIVGNESLIRKIYVPKLVFPVSRLLLNAIIAVLSMVALFVLMIPLGARFSLPMLSLPLAMICFSAFCLGLGMVVSVVNTYYRDFGHLVAVFMQAWYFLTPIIYPASQLPPEIRWRFWLNPLYPFIRIFQLILSDGEWPGLILFLTTAGLAAVTLGVGYAVFKTYEDKLVFRL